MISTKNFLIIVIVACFVFVSIKFYFYYDEYSVWQYSDWLINYQGGFVRRGLIGEILFNIYKFSSISLNNIILTFVISLYFFLSFFLIKSIKYLKNSYTNILIFLSPGFFLYPIMNSEIVGRKDILIIFAIGFLVFFEKYFRNKILLSLVLLLLIFVSLSHSGLLFYTPYIIFLFFLIKFSRNESVNFYEFFSIIFILLLIVFLILFNQEASVFKIKEICDSVKKFVIENCENTGQFYSLSFSAKESIIFYGLSERYKNYLIIYLISLIIVYFFIGTKLFFAKFKTHHLFLNKINPLLIFILLFLFTLPIYVLGIDWGRWIYISYSCSFFIYVFCLKNESLIFHENRIFKTKTTNKILIFILIFFYSFVWTFPFYNAVNFKLVLKKPLIKIIEKLN